MLSCQCDQIGLFWRLFAEKWWGKNHERTHTSGESITSLKGECSRVWLYNWSPVLQVWNQLLIYIQWTTYFLVKSSLARLETSCRYSNTFPNSVYSLVLVSNFVAQVAQIFDNFLLFLKNVTFEVNTTVATFGPLFILTSGHTVPLPPVVCFLLRWTDDIRRPVNRWFNLSNKEEKRTVSLNDVVDITTKR